MTRFFNLFGAESSKTKQEARGRYALALIYGNTFATPDGRAVLADMLDEGCIFRPINTEEDRARHNAMIATLVKMGIAHDQATEVLVDAILRIPVMDPDHDYDPTKERD